MLERWLLSSHVTNSLCYRFIEILSLNFLLLLIFFLWEWCCKNAISIWTWLQSKEEDVLAENRHSWCHLLSKEKLLSRWSLQDRIMKIALIYTSCKIDERKSDSDINDIVKEQRVWIAVHRVFCSSLRRSFAQLRFSHWFRVVTICILIVMCQELWVTFLLKIWLIHLSCVFIALMNWIFLKMRCIDARVIVTMFFTRSFNVSMSLNQVVVSSVDSYLLTQHHLLMSHWIKILTLQSCLRMIKILFPSFTTLLRTSNEIFATSATRLTLT